MQGEAYDDDNRMVELITSDQVSFKVEYDTIKACETLKNLMEDAGLGHPIPLPRVSSRALRHVLEYTSRSAEYWAVLDAILDEIELCELLCACNYLEQKNMLDTVSSYFAHLIQTNDSKSLSRRFRAEREFTVEERHVMMEEQGWCQEIDE
jgi:hypothetical protein